MEFDPLSLFTAPSPKIQDDVRFELRSVPPSQHTNVAEEDAQDIQNLDDPDAPIHIHDMPLLQLKPPYCVFQVFLKLLAPETVRNFEPSITDNADKCPETIFADKHVSDMVTPSLKWLQEKSCRFQNENQLSAIPLLSEMLKINFLAEYNAWLTRIISSELAWLDDSQAEEVRRLASLRLAENCGRSAQPEFVREIEIAELNGNILLREPSLTADNLGLKTWGSSYILGRRLAANQHKNYLKGSILELGAGTGLVGMVACRLGFPTMLTDLEEILPNLRANVELNNIVNAEVEELDWSDPSGFLARRGSTTYDTIILSDPLYSSRHPPWIVNMINQFLSNDKEARVLLQLPIRRNFEKERANLWKLLLENNLVVEEEELEAGYDDFGETKFHFKKLVRDKN